MTKKEMEAANKARVEAEQNQFDAKQLRAARKAQLRELSDVARCIEGVCITLLDAESQEKLDALDGIIRAVRSFEVDILAGLIPVLGAKQALGDDALPELKGGSNND